MHAYVYSEIDQKSVRASKIGQRTSTLASYTSNFREIVL